MYDFISKRLAKSISALVKERVRVKCKAVIQLGGLRII